MRDDKEERQRRLKTVNYVASDRFLRGTTWFAKGSFSLRSLFDAAGGSHRLCTIVGKVSPIGLKMSTHGDFVVKPTTTSATHSSFSMSYLRLVLESPGDPPYACDFVKAVKSLQAVAGTLRCEGKRNEPFMPEVDDAVERLYFRYRMFQPKYMYTPADFEQTTRELSDYEVDPDYTPFLQAISSTHVSRELSIRDSDGQLLEMSSREDYLLDSLAEIKFTVDFDPAHGLIADIDSIRLLH